MYWSKLDSDERRELAHHIYLAALSVTDTDDAHEVCREAIERAGARTGEAERIARLTHENFLRGIADARKDSR